MLFRTTFAAALFTTAVFAAGSAAVEAASFNCRYAKLPAEVAICQDDELHGLDERMASVYFTLRRLLPYDGRAELKGGQNAFIARRNACGYDTDCVARSYRIRIKRMCRLANDYDLDCDEFGD